MKDKAAALIFALALPYVFGLVMGTVLTFCVFALSAYGHGMCRLIVGQ